METGTSSKLFLVAKATLSKQWLQLDSLIGIKLPQEKSSSSELELLEHALKIKTYLPSAKPTDTSQQASRKHWQFMQWKLACRHLRKYQDKPNSSVRLEWIIFLVIICPSKHIRMLKHLQYSDMLPATMALLQLVPFEISALSWAIIQNFPTKLFHLKAPVHIAGWG